MSLAIKHMTNNQAHTNKPILASTNSLIWATTSNDNKCQYQETYS